MINLLPDSAASEVLWQKIKHQVMAGATMVVVGYLLLVAAIAGRAWYLAQRSHTVSAEIAALTSQVAALAPVEANLRQQAHRLGLIQDILANRVSFAAAAATFSASQIAGWEYTPPGSAKVLAVASSSAELENYALDLVPKYQQVTITSLGFAPKSVSWQELLDLQP